MAENHGVFTKNDRTRIASTAAEAVEFRYAGWTEQATDSEGQILRGDDLDKELEKAGLSKAGSASDKRARLAQHTDQAQKSKS